MVPGLEEKRVERRLVCRSSQSAGHAVEVGSCFRHEGRAITLDGFHLAETGLVRSGAAGVGLVDVGGGGRLHDPDGASGGLQGHAQGDVGLLKAVEAAVVEHGGIASQQRIADVAQHDLTIAQAGSHAAVGIAITPSLDQAGVLADHAGHRIGHDAGSIGGDGVDGVETLITLGNIIPKGGQFATADSSIFGVSAYDSAGKGVEHGG